jgi:hypothetical protein
MFNATPDSVMVLMVWNRPVDMLNAVDRRPLRRYGRLFFSFLSLSP